MKASVKVMRSFDYCHFEICLGFDDDVTIHEVRSDNHDGFSKAVDELRKEAAKLADKAVVQYKQAKEHYSNVLYRGKHIKHCRKEVEEIKKIPESERTPRQKAQIKALADYEFMLTKKYDYQDDWEDCWDATDDDPDDEMPF